MHEGGFAHHARRRTDAARYANLYLVQFRVDGFEFFSRRSLARLGLAHDCIKGIPERFTGDELAYSLRVGDCCNGIFASGHVAALELVRVDIADHHAQPFEVLAARARLVIVFDEWDTHKNIVNGKR
jgi:hypothetical protein